MNDNNNLLPSSQIGPVALSLDMSQTLQLSSVNREDVEDDGKTGFVSVTFVDVADGKTYVVALSVSLLHEEDI